MKRFNATRTGFCSDALVFECRQSRDQGNPEKPSTSSCPPLKWSRLLFSVWSLALEASASQPLCDRCHIDEEHRSRTCPDFSQQPNVSGEVSPSAACRRSKTDYLLMIVFKLQWEFLVFTIESVLAVNKPPGESGSCLDGLIKCISFFKCWNQYPTIIINMRALESDARKDIQRVINAVYFN